MLSSVRVPTRRIRDRSSMTLVVEDLAGIVVSGSFELGTSGVERLRPDNSDLSAISQVLDNALLDWSRSSSISAPS